MINEQYMRYEHRMFVLAKIWKWVKAHYKTAILPPLFAIIAVLVFLAIIGSVFGAIECSDSVCGEAPEVSANVFLSDSYYEYAPKDSGEWSADIPDVVGEYQLRIVSKNGFGKQRYSKAAEFRVIPAELKFGYTPISCVYGDSATYLSGLVLPMVVGGHRIDGIELSFKKLSGTKTEVSVVAFKVFDKSGNDVTSSYTNIPSSGEWTVTPRNITVASKDASKEYDGGFLEGSGEYISSGSLAEGDKLEITYRARLSDAGTAENKITAEIVNSRGEEVTEFYSVDYSYGTLTLNRRKLTVSTQSSEKVYDGKPLSGDTSYTVVSGLLEGHRSSVLSAATLTDAGSVPNAPVLKIVDASGKDVSDNYETVAKNGILTVTKRPITLKSGSAEKVYNGSPLINDSFEITQGSLVEGHAVTAAFNPDRPVYAGSYQNGFTCSVSDRNKNDVTSNYDVRYENGTLTINPIVLKFTTGSATKTYDGTPLTQSSWKQTEGAILSGHSLSGTYTTGSRTDAGESENTLYVSITDKNGESVIGGTNKIYEISVECGTLRVNKRKASISSLNAEKVYDGTPLTKRGYISRGVGSGDSSGLLPNHYPTISYTGSQTEPGSSDNTFTVTAISYVGNDVTSNYEIETSYGVLTVYKPEGSGDRVPSSTGTAGGNNNGNSGNNSGSGGKKDDSNSGKVGPSDLKYYELGGPMSKEDAHNKKVYANFTVNGLTSDTAIYFRTGSYGDYDGNGWEVAEPFQFTHSPIFFPGTQMSLSSMSKYRHSVSIELLEDCPTLVPYYVSYTDAERCGFNSSDINPEFDTRTEEYSLFVYLGANAQELRQNASWIRSNEPKYRDHVYKTYLTIPESTKKAMLDIAEANNLDKDSPTIINDVKNYISHAATYKLNINEFPEGVDKAVYFLTVTKEGYCQHFATAATLMFRALGIPARYAHGFLSQANPGGVESKVLGEQAHAWTEVYIDGIGWVQLEVTGSSEDATGGEAENGKKPEDGGEGENGKKPEVEEGEGEKGKKKTNADGEIMITVSAYSAEKYYDGRPFGESVTTKYWISTGELDEGHRLVATVVESEPNMVTPGISYNVIESYKVYDRNGKDVTDSYRIKVSSGVSEILKRPLIIASASATKVYDGFPLSAKQYWIVSGSVAENQKLEVSVSGSITEVGEVSNELTYDLRDVYGLPVSRYYEITLINGSLTVTPNE